MVSGTELTDVLAVNPGKAEVSVPFRGGNDLIFRLGENGMVSFVAGGAGIKH